LDQSMNKPSSFPRKKLLHIWCITFISNVL
jgi:hypothetical protein